MTKFEELIFNELKEVREDIAKVNVQVVENRLKLWFIVSLVSILSSGLVAVVLPMLIK